ncbi:MAG: hypothetical protein A2Y97_10910 [Nitrospirae bacterium RBG_13_39_12]|nr:MAG: hypothetical protein A2Y97_10910 [Nitrospirae bacterium RBG_13_39_12]
MLKGLRKHAKYFYFLFFIVILSFVFWGMGRVDNTGGKDIVAEVGKYKISATDYWNTYDRVFRFYREIYKDKFDEEMEKKMNLKENVLDSMIDERILLTEAKELGISVSDEELQESIIHEPAFMRNSVFDNNVYINRLRLIRVTPEEYENSKRQELTIKKMRRLIELSVDSSNITFNLGNVSGDNQVTQMLNEQMLNDRKEKALKSYIEGLKKQIKIIIYKERIS